uniref:DNA polymerase beta n=1 Tax=viral metagenome TaxID=1070528 RepID=A0A6C0KWD2_9ZZZZ
MDYKQTIINALDVLRKRDLADKQPFKARAYANVIGQLKRMDQPVQSYDDLAAIQGMGDKIEKKIKEILETGSLRSAEKAKEMYHIDVLDQLQNIYGIGPAKATELVQAGIRSIQQLRDEVKQHPKMLNDKQKVGLKYYEELLERIPREEMMEHEDVVKHYGSSLSMEIVGSYRRGALNSGDIDVLIKVPTGTPAATVKKQLADYVQSLLEAGYIEEILALGEHKCMAICRLDESGTARRLDLLMTPEEEYAYALLYFTGSDRFNVAFRQYALDKGYTLNEHVLTPTKVDIPVPPFMKSEKAIFAFLRLRYIDPDQRVDGNQIIPLYRRPAIAI